MIFALLSLCVCVTIPITALLGSQSSFGQVSDFPEFYTAAKMSASGQGAQIYQLNSLFQNEHEFFPEMKGRGLGFYIPPFAVPLLAGLSIFSAKTAFLIFIAASISAIGGSIYFLRRLFCLGNMETIWLAALLCASAPVFESLKLAQLAPFLLFGFTGFLWLAELKKDIAAASALSLLFLKPQELFPIALFLLGSRNWKIIGELCMIFAVLVALSMICPGLEAYKQYLQLLHDSANNTIFMQPELSATIRGQLLRIPQLSAWANAISASALASAASLILWISLTQSKTAQTQRSRLLCAALPLGLLSAFHCHDYDLLLLTPWFIAVWKNDAADLITKASKLSCAILFALLIVPFYIPIHYRWLLEQGQVFNPIFFAFLSASILSTVSLLRQKQNKAEPLTQ